MNAANAFVTLLLVVDPVMTIPVFMELTRSFDAAARRRVAVKGTIVATCVLLLFVFLGDGILRWLSVSFPAFRIAGGALLFLLAVDMVFARRSGISTPTTKEEEEAIRREDISVFPLAFPLIAGPGAVTMVLLLVTEARGDAAAFARVLAVVGAVMVVTLLVLLLAPRIGALLGDTGANVIARVFGLLLSAMAVQFIVDGIRESFF